MLEAAQDAEDAVNDIKGSLDGPAQNIGSGRDASRLLAHALKDLITSNDGLKLSVFASDKNIDLVGEQIDIAIRAGDADISDFIYHPLCRVRNNIYASPDYLKNYGNPVIPDDLRRHQWLGHEGSSSVVLTHSNGSVHQYHPDHRIDFDDLNVLAGHVLEGMGVAVLPDIEVKPCVLNGSLIRVLPEWSAGYRQLYALTLDRKTSLKTKAALKELKRFFCD